jgi:hypothetical protein
MKKKRKLRRKTRKENKKEKRREKRPLKWDEKRKMGASGRLVRVVEHRRAFDCGPMFRRGTSR